MERRAFIKLAGGTVAAGLSEAVGAGQALGSSLSERIAISSQAFNLPFEILRYERRAFATHAELVEHRGYLFDRFSSGGIDQDILDHVYFNENVLPDFMQDQTTLEAIHSTGSDPRLIFYRESTRKRPSTNSVPFSDWLRVFNPNCREHFAMAVPLFLQEVFRDNHGFPAPSIPVDVSRWPAVANVLHRFRGRALWKEEAIDVIVLAGSSRNEAMDLLGWYAAWTCGPGLYEDKLQPDKIFNAIGRLRSLTIDGTSVLEILETVCPDGCRYSFRSKDFAVGSRLYWVLTQAV